MAHPERVVAGFGFDEKSTVIDHVDYSVQSCLDKTPQLVTTFLGQLMQHFVTKPVIASRVVESDFKLRPRTIEEVGPVDVLVNQQRNTVGCKNGPVW